MASRTSGSSPPPPETLGIAYAVRSIPIVNYSIGMVIPQRDPMTPLIAAVVQVAREVAPTLES
jgi:hypothetical protein